MRALIVAGALWLAGCPAPSTPVPPRPEPSPLPAFDTLGWIVGDWLAQDESSAEFWTFRHGQYWGISLADGGFEHMVIDAGDDGGPRLTPAPGGKRSVSFALAESTPASARFTNALHDDPTSISYAHESGAGPAPERLVATLDGPGGVRTFAFAHLADAPEAPREAVDAALNRGAAASPPPAAGMFMPYVPWSRRSLPDGRHAAVIIDKDPGEDVLVILRQGDDGAWARVYEDRRP